jgi:hypothetical protein
VKWDPPYDAMVNSGDPTKLQYVRAACGDRYIETVFNEARLFLVIHVSSQQSSTLTSFSGKANGSINIDVVSATTALAGDLSVKSANLAGALSFEAYSLGYGGVQPTSAFLATISPSDGLSALATKLGAALASANPPGQPVKLSACPTSQLLGIPVGDLSDQRIFDYLEGSKDEYAAASIRTANISSLSAADERRTFFNEPQADVILRNQQLSLAAYLNSVAAAHDQCRKAAQLSVCVSLDQDTIALPDRATAELPPVVAPVLGSFTIAINGVPLLPGQPATVSVGASVLRSSDRRSDGVERGYRSTLDGCIFVFSAVPRNWPCSSNVAPGTNGRSAPSPNG